MRTAIASAAMALLLVTSAQAAEPGPAAAEQTSARPSIITNPDWVRRPRPEDIMRFMPQTAQAFGLSGAATIVCKVAVTTRLYECDVVSEDPGGFGFGDAALKMAVTFEMKPKTVDGQPVDGGTVRIPLRFNQSAGRPVTRPPRPAASPEALALARWILGGIGGAERGRRQQLTRALAEIALPENDSSINRADYERVVRAGVNASFDELTEDMAAQLATRMSFAEMEQILAFSESTAGKALERALTGSASTLPEAGYYAMIGTNAARAEYCRGRDCSQPKAVSAK